MQKFAAFILSVANKFPQIYDNFKNKTKKRGILMNENIIEKLSKKVQSNLIFYVWSTLDGDTIAYQSLDEMKGDSAGFQGNIDEDETEIGILVPTLDEKFVNTHEHAFVKIKIIKDTMFYKEGRIQYVETDSSNLQSPKEVIDYLNGDEYEIIESYYGVPLIFLNCEEVSGDDEDYFWRAVKSAEKMDIEGIFDKKLSEFKRLGIKIKTV
jgi:hypothetical protein